MQCVAMCCSDLKLLSSHCLCVLQFVAVCIAVNCSLLQRSQFTVYRLSRFVPASNVLILCITLQHTAAHRNTLQHAATHCNTLQHTATHCNTLQHAAKHTHRTYKRESSPPPSTARCHLSLQHTATRCTTLQHTAPHCTTLQYAALHCNTLQHVAKHADASCTYTRNSPKSSITVFHPQKLKKSVVGFFR